MKNISLYKFLLPLSVVMLVTGAQGDELADLMRVATKKHRHIKIRDTDTVLFSSSVVGTRAWAYRR